MYVFIPLMCLAAIFIVLSMLLVQDDGQELLQACISEQWDMAKVLIMTGSTLEAQDEVMSSRYFLTPVG